MKKLIASIMIMAVLMTTHVLAGELDLSSYSVDELLELQKEVNDELYDRDQLVKLPFGEYLVGRDIAAGIYRIDPHKNEDEDWNTAWTAIVFKDKDAKAQYEQVQNEYQIAYLNARQKENAGESVEYPVPVNNSQYTNFYVNVGCHESLNVTLEDGELFVVQRGYDDVVELSISKASAGLFME